MASLALADTDNAAALATRPALSAFLTDAESERIIRDLFPERGAETIRRGNIAKAVEYLWDHRSPELLIVDISGVDLPLSAIRQLSEVCEPGVQVIAVGDRNEVGLYRDLVQLGISDYIVKPLTLELMTRAVSVATHRAAGTPIAQKLGKVIAVMGSRGGIGTTTVATNLAWHLAHRGGRRVALVDLDLQTGDSSLILNLKPTSALREALENPHRIDNLYLERVMVPHGERLFVLSSEEALNDELHVTPESVEKLVTSLQSDFHYIILDLPRTPTAATKRAIALANLRLIVSDSTIRSAREIARLQNLLGVGPASERNFLVINRQGERRPGAVPEAEFLATVRLRPLATIPLIARMQSRAVDYGVPDAAHRGPIADAMAVLAGEISGRPVAPEKKTWWQPWR